MLTLLTSLSLWLQPEATSNTPAAPGGGGGGAPPAGCAGGMSQLGLMLVMIAVLYLVMIRPQQKRQKEHDALLAALKKGQKVRTTGGIRGEIIDFKDNEVVLLIADRTKINILRSHIAGLVEAKESA